ncbi:chemotaxis-specific protein-glutamate methyltransferase CheB [Frigidibacter sp. RF13]|uniref:chemotaxis-specific protein-glutamate methyltransferase CheB n=1 Tax=Frigidibacter sp. RF13 TaxID=2997340 RepID=UPI0022716212|nr:chemotaxis-specific protein-glutamate methyltransferase CheB [Frigidibacter sp. RF13]MCY1125361.1 chemotaxis-specific protein-glutamate methyltransferase CheB [Frigidibacter sp. RF13]
MAGRSSEPAPNAPPAVPLRVMVVDDSPTQRRLLAHHLSGDGRIELVASAADCAEAAELLPKARADVLLLDIEMPGCDGLTFLRHLMGERPMPVVILSSLAAAGSAAALEALALGAVDCLEKAAGSYARGPGGLVQRLVSAAAATPALATRRLKLARAARAAARKVSAVASSSGHWERISLVGASTGGVAALEEMLAVFPADGPAVVVAQHMPPVYVERIAERFERSFLPRVRIARHGERIVPGHVYLAPGKGSHVVLQPLLPLTLGVAPVQGPRGHSPSVDRLFASALPHAAAITAVVLSGMGRDGATGMLDLRALGARTLAQDARTSLIYGMPGAAAALGAAEELLPPGQIGERLLSLCAPGARPVVVRRRTLGSG